MYAKPSHIVSIKKLEDAWRASPDSKGRGKAPGIDGFTAISFGEKLSANLQQLKKELVKTEFHFSKLRLSPIEKGDDTYRIICIPTVKDRLVQRLILNHLTVPKDRLGVENKISFGVKKGEGTREAIELSIKKREQYPWVLKTDIAKFFDNIPRKYLKAKIRKKLKKSSLVPLIEKIIDCEISIKSKFQQQLVRENGIEAGKGLRQGMPLSPLLSNFVLINFDKKVERKGLKVIRYVDDLIAFASSEEECNRIKNFIEVELKSELNLVIPGLGDKGSKTTIHKPNEPVIFLGVEIYKTRGNGYAQKIPRKTWDKALTKIRQHSDLDWNMKPENDYSYTDVIRRIKEIPDGYKSSFAKCTNWRDLYNLLEEEGKKVKQEILIKIFGEDVFNKLTDKHRKFLGFSE